MPLSGLASVAARLAGKGANKLSLLPPSAAKIKHPSTINTPEFKNWFKNSEGIDEGGLPLPAYHATNSPFTSFRPMAPYLDEGQMFNPKVHEGLSFFTLNPEWASKWLSSTHIPKSVKGPSKKAALVEKEVLEDVVKGKKITGQKWKQLSKISHLLPDTEPRILPTYLSVQKLFHPEKHAHLALPTKSTIKRKLSNLLESLPPEKGYAKGWPTIHDSFNKGFFKGNYSKNNYWTPEDMKELARNYSGEDIDTIRSHFMEVPEVDPYIFMERYKALKKGNFQAIEQEDILRRIKSLGFDGIKMSERMGGEEGINIAVWNPRKIKSDFNEGTWNPRSKNIGKEVGGMIERNPYPYQARAI